MNSVGRVDPRIAGDVCDQLDPGGEAAPAPTNASAELLIGFLADFHAAGREPARPDPAGTATPTTGPLPSRLSAFAPPDPNAFDESADPLPADPLPTWPPVPPPESEAQAGTAQEPEGDRKQPRLRRLGRRKGD